MWYMIKFQSHAVLYKKVAVDGAHMVINGFYVK